MTDHLVTVTCRLSTLRTIAEALSWAHHHADERARMIMHFQALHNDNPEFPEKISDGLDDVKYYQQDAETYRQAHNLAFNLWATSSEIIDPEAIAFYERWHSTDAEAPQTQATALSEFVPF